MMRVDREQRDENLFAFLSSYIINHPELLQHISNCVIPKPEDIELFDYTIRTVSVGTTDFDTVVLDIQIEAHIDVYRFGRGLQDEPEQITEWYRMEACLDFGEFQIKCLGISLCEDV